MAEPKGWTPLSEQAFLRDYLRTAKQMGWASNPDDPAHFYDYRAAWLNGALVPDKSGHFSSKYKLPGHPNYYMSPDGKMFAPKPQKGWIDTTTMKVVP
jgi:hypothetical protein